MTTAKTQFGEDARHITNLAFENKLFIPEITRTQMDAFEDYIEYCLNSRYESAKKLEAIIKKTK